MAFDESKLTLIAHGSGNQLFQYITDDSLETVETAGYAKTITMRKGDAIIVSAGLGDTGTPEVGLYVVAKVADGVASLASVSTATQTSDSAG